MSQQPAKRNFSRRKALAGIGASGVVLAQYATKALAQETPTETEESDVGATLVRYPTANALKAPPALQEGALVETAGFHVPGDGG